MEEKFMLCKSIKESELKNINLNNFLASEKKDGTRAKAIIQNGKCLLIGRRGTSYENKFPEIANALKTFEGFVFDGEICCEDFQKTQSRTLTQDKLKSKLLAEKYPAIFYFFDLPNVNLPFFKRLELLNSFEFPDKCIQKVKNTSDIFGLLEQAKREKWEGIVLKNVNAFYQNKRSNDWLKLKLVKSRDIEFYEYTLNPAGVRAVSKEGIAVQVSGFHSKEFLKEFEKKGFAVVEVEYLEEFKSGFLRQPVCKEVKK